MNKFTETATGALNLALECARELGHSFIGSQHLLFGLSAQEGGLTQPPKPLCIAYCGYSKRIQQQEYVFSSHMMKWW